MISDFADWLSASALNDVLEPSAYWIIPAVQIVHILSIAAIISSMIMVHGRLLHAGFVRQTVAQTNNRFLPWLWVALLVLLLTGLLLILMEPNRTLGRPIFWLKMAAVVAAVAMTAWLQHDVKRRPTFWSSDTLRPAIVLFALVNLGVWTFIVFAGRWIAYA